MAFYPIYYITLVCPDLATSKQKMEEYIAHGARALQIDMPSKDPVFETPFVRENMKRALLTYEGYDKYLDFFRELREKYPHLELHLVVYPDVVESIGREKFVSFCKKISIASFMPVTSDHEYRCRFKKDGLVIVENMDGNLPDAEVEYAAGLKENEVITLNYKRHRECTREDCVTFRDKIDYLRKQGVTARIYAVEGITDAGMMREVKEAGAERAFVGNVLMRLWDDEKSLWELFDAFQEQAVPQHTV